MTEQIQIGSRLQRLQQMTEASRPQPKSQQRNSSSPRIASKRPMTAQKTAADVRADVRSAERARMMAVFDSEQVAGNEFGAAFLLSSTDFPAEDIIENLPLFQLSHDDFREIAAARQDPSTKSENHGWNDIHAEIRERRETQSDSSTKSENHGWSDIHDEIQSRGAVQ